MNFASNFTVSAWIDGYSIITKITLIDMSSSGKFLRAINNQWAGLADSSQRKALALVALRIVKNLI